TDAKHKNEIEVTTWSWGETNSSTVVPANTGRADLHDLHFTARTSSASPLLFISCASGTHAATAVLTARQAAVTQIEYLKITMTDVLISSYQSGGSSSDNLPLDQVSLNFAKIQFSYTPQISGGLPGTPITRGWDKALATSF